MTDGPTDAAAPAQASAPDAPPAPAIGRALALLGVYVALTLPIFGWFYVNASREGREAAMLWFLAAQTIGAVLLPTAVSFFWPRAGAPRRLPSYVRPDRDVILGALFVSLPLYALSVSILFATGAWDPGRATPTAPGATHPAAPGFAALAGLWIVLALLPAIAEELMYRGVIQPAMVHRWGAAWGIGVTAGLFSAFHMDPAGLVPRVLMGAWFGYLAWRTRSLWASTWAHLLNNTWGVALLAVLEIVTTRPSLVAVVSAASLAAGVWCFRRAGWWAPAGEPPSAPKAGGPRKIDPPGAGARSGGGPPHRHEQADPLDQRPVAEGLREEAVAARGLGLAAIGVRGLRGHGDDRDVARAVVLLEDLRRRQAVEHGHQDVHQDQIGLLADGLLDPFLAVVGNEGLEALVLQDDFRHFLVGDFIFDDEDFLHKADYSSSRASRHPACGAGASGRRLMKPTAIMISPPRNIGRLRIMPAVTCEKMNIRWASGSRKNSPMMRKSP